MRRGVTINSRICRSSTDTVPSAQATSQRMSYIISRMATARATEANDSAYSNIEWVSVFAARKARMHSSRFSGVRPSRTKARSPASISVAST